MGKRSEFERKDRDFYPTPYKAVEPLLPHLPESFTFAEPCAGDGRLISHLTKHGGDVRYALDIEPMHEWIKYGDALTQGYTQCDYIAFSSPLLHTHASGQGTHSLGLVFSLLSKYQGM